MGQCLNCKKDIQEYTGRRPRKYCSDSCRQKFFQVKVKTKASKKEEKSATRPTTIKEPPSQPVNEFMGTPIPEGLDGIPLAVWKNNIKIGKKKK